MAESEDEGSSKSHLPFFPRPRHRAAAAIVKLTNGVARWNPPEKGAKPTANDRTPFALAITGVACLTEVADPTLKLEVLVADKVEFVAPLLLIHKHPTQRIRVPIQVGRVDDVKLHAGGYDGVLHEGTLLIGLWYVESYDGR